MLKDELVEEVRKAREALAARWAGALPSESG